MIDYATLRDDKIKKDVLIRKIRKIRKIATKGKREKGTTDRTKG